MEKNPNVKVIGHYVDATTKITHLCIIHNIEWETTPTRALLGRGCPKCHNERISKKKTRTNEWYKNAVKDINISIIPLEPYIDCRTPIRHYCNEHKYEWLATPDNILNGHGCPLCGAEKCRCKNMMPYTEYINRLQNVNSNIICIGKYECATKHVLHKCLIDGHEWMAVPSQLLSGRGCPKCSESHGERKIREWLNDQHIKYYSQYRFDGCKNIKELPFDFYLPDYNMAIEYDVEQHFRAIDYFGGEEALKKRKSLDEIKNNFCKDHNILLLRIPFNKNVETELNNYFLT